jgi:hypothetical protein
MNLDYIYMLIFIMVIGFFYRRFLDKYDNEELQNYEKIKKYLLNDSSIAKSKKPILWIHIPYEINSRSWSSFYSRTNDNLNLPFINLCIQSIIDKCGKSFKICLIDDKSFNNLIPGWNVDLNRVGSPIKEKIRYLASLKLLYNYGGLFVPKSFLCFKNLVDTHNEFLVDYDSYIFENINKIHTNNSLNFFPNPKFIGSIKESETIEALIRDVELLISNDQTDESYFLGELNKYCFKYITSNNMKLVDGKNIGIKDKDNNQILLDTLFSKNYSNFCNFMIGIHIDDEELLKRTHYNWFCKLNKNDVLDCDNTLGDLFRQCL